MTTDLEVTLMRGPTFKYESHLPSAFGGPYDWHLIDGRLTLRKRPPTEEHTDRW
jgi:hypothetical protein